MLPYKRSNRVAKSIQRSVNDFLQKEINADGLGIITITDTEVSSDLRHASVYYSVYGSDEEKKKASDILIKITSSLRGYVGRQIKLRYTPEIVFRYDGTIEYAARIDKLINQINKEKNE